MIPRAVEYETVSHLTLTQAVKLARQHKTRDQWAQKINDSWKQREDSQREMATHLANAHKCFKGDDDLFKKWLAEALHFSPDFAETVVGLVGKDYDDDADDAWVNALLTDMEAGNFPPGFIQQQEAAGAA